MADFTINDLLEAGLTLEDILLKKNDTSVNVTVDTAPIAESLDKNNKTQLQALSELKKELSTSNAANKDLLIKSLSAIFKKQSTVVPVEKPITGIKVIRNSNNLITDLKLVRG